MTAKSKQRQNPFEFRHDGNWKLCLTYWLNLGRGFRLQLFGFIVAQVVISSPHGISVGDGGRVSSNCVTNVAIGFLWFSLRFPEELPEDHAPSLTSVIRQNLSVIMAPPEDQLQQQIAWPETAELYQPYESNQILLPDSSACLAVRTFLHMNGLHFKVTCFKQVAYSGICSCCCFGLHDTRESYCNHTSDIMTWQQTRGRWCWKLKLVVSVTTWTLFQVMLKPNAEQMSPSGRLPFLVCGKQLISEVEPIIDFVNTRFSLYFPVIN